MEGIRDFDDAVVAYEECISHRIEESRVIYKCYDNDNKYGFLRNCKNGISTKGLAFWAMSTHLAHVQPFIGHNPQVLLLRAALSEFITQSVLLSGIFPPQVQDLALGLVELHEVPMGSLLKFVQVPLDGIPFFCCVSCTVQLGVIRKLAEDAFNITVYSIQLSVTLILIKGY
ncbi:hypothetical protein DUI87_16848 [Hirundo rustica rustica]|uniref:Uncharacterized protein n=1 Tax=Hirundo rustica rustica TaxID=333673 RepID=A0A3M0K2K2_HIRRU|nr:hypothetical protein DUI87_16848 [Hirundo rustica rustica]